MFGYFSFVQTELPEKTSLWSDVLFNQNKSTKELLLYSLKISWCLLHLHTHTRTHSFNGPLSRTTRVSRYQKGKTNLDFTEGRDSEWHWHQLGHMQVCISLQTDNHASTPPLSFLQAGCPSCRPTNSVEALKTSLFAFAVSFNSVVVIISV